MAPMGAAAVTSASTSFFYSNVGTRTTQKTSIQATHLISRHVSTSVTNMMEQSIKNSSWKQYKRLHSTEAAKATTNTTSSATTSTPKQSKGILQWYEGHLQARPVATKAVTGSILWGLGDVVAQVVPPLTQSFKESDDTSSTTNTAIVYDYPRTARAMFFGFGIHAPLSHLHFNFLEWMTIKGGFTGMSIPVFKAFMEQFVYWSWFSNSLYHGAMGAMQGKSLEQIYDRIADVLWDTQKAQWVFWIPVQLLNFQFVPVRHQLNVVLMTSVVWTALLSAWYPPEEEDKGVDNVSSSTDEKE